jgi:hypothetical protein
MRHTLLRKLPMLTLPSSVCIEFNRLVSRFLEGYNVTVLAYGQTSSGKSYTMGTDTTSAPSSSSAHSSPVFSSSSASPHLGEDSSRAGIIPRAIKQVFDEIKRRTNSENGKIRFETRNSYVEIYSESLVSFEIELRWYRPCFSRKYTACLVGTE